MGYNIIGKNGKSIKHNNPIQAVYALPGESGIFTEGVSEQRVSEFAKMVAEGVTGDADLMKALRLSQLQVRMLFRSKIVQQMIRDEARAVATLAFVDTVKSAANDVKDKDGRTRAEARKFIKAVAEGPPASSVVQQNNQITEWSPEKDEALYERARALVEDSGKRIVAETVKETLDQLGEGEDQ